MAVKRTFWTEKRCKPIVLEKKVLWGPKRDEILLKSALLVQPKRRLKKVQLFGERPLWLLKKEYSVMFTTGEGDYEM